MNNNDDIPEIKKRPISWTLEELIFGAIALRDEIKQRKKNGEHYGFINNIEIHFWMYVFLIAGIFLCLWCMLVDGVYLFFQNLKSKINLFRKKLFKLA